jgi:site-specific recombinase XerD
VNVVPRLGQAAAQAAEQCALAGAGRAIALEPRTLELVRWHRGYLTRRNHPGIKTGLLFPSEAGTRPVGNDQLNDVWREVQVLAGIDRPVAVHGIRHSFHASPGSKVCPMRS